MNRRSCRHSKGRSALTCTVVLLVCLRFLQQTLIFRYKRVWAMLPTTRGGGGVLRKGGGVKLIRLVSIYFCDFGFQIFDFTSATAQSLKNKIPKKFYMRYQKNMLPQIKGLQTVGIVFYTITMIVAHLEALLHFVSFENLKFEIIFFKL